MMVIEQPLASKTFSPQVTYTAVQLNKLRNSEGGSRLMLFRVHEMFIFFKKLVTRSTA